MASPINKIGRHAQQLMGAGNFQTQSISEPVWDTASQFQTIFTHYKIVGLENQHNADFASSTRELSDTRRNECYKIVVE